MNSFSDLQRRQSAAAATKLNAKMPARPAFIAFECSANSAATLCHVSGDINLHNCLVRSIIFVHIESRSPCA